MGILDVLRKGDRKSWFVCYSCMLLTSHDAVKSIFYYTGPPVDVFGRPVTPCRAARAAIRFLFSILRRRARKPSFGAWNRSSSGTRGVPLK
jgi:hypothetical protein